MITIEFGALAYEKNTILVPSLSPAHMYPL